MSVKKINKVVLQCTCDLPDCVGKGVPWIAKSDRVPPRCKWCGRYTWNGEDKRRKLPPVVTKKGKKAVTA